MKNADQSRDDSMEEILASIRKIIADDEAAGVALDPRAPVDAPMSLEVGNLEAAFAGEPFFDLNHSASQEALMSELQPEPTASEDIMELSEDFLVAEGEFDNPFLTPAPFQAETRRNAPDPSLRIEPELSASSRERTFTPSPFLDGPSARERNAPETESPAAERRSWDGQPPPSLRAQRTETAPPQRPVASPEKETPASVQSTPAPQFTPSFSNGASSGGDARAKPVDQAPLRPPSRQGWAGARETNRDAMPGFDPRPRPSPGLEENAGEPLWAQPDLDAHALKTTPRTPAPRKDQAPAPKEPTLRAPQPSPARQESTPAPTHSHSRLSAPVTQSGLAAVSMPHLPDSPSDGPIASISTEGETGGRPQYFQAMAEELVRATVHGLGDRELTRISEKPLPGAHRPELRTIAESFAETMSHSTFTNDAGISDEESDEDEALYGISAEPPNTLPMSAPATPLSRNAVAPKPAAQPMQAVTNTQKSFEEGFKDLLKPMLTEWLDENMPRLLENAIQEELERRSRGKRD